MKNFYKLLFFAMLLFPAVDAVGGVDVIKERVVPPTVSVNDDDICQGTPIVLTAVGTGTITWHTTPDGSDPSIGTGSTFTHTPTSTTTYYAKANGEVSNPGVLVTVHNKPTISIATPPSNICSGTPVVFNSTVTGGTAPYIYSWTFGGGGTATDPNPSHTFTSLGCTTENFQINVTVTDANGCTGTAQQTITIKQQPHLEIGDSDIFHPFSNCHNNPSINTPNYSLTITNQSNNISCSVYSVNWGDGVVQNNATFPLTHNYTQLGAFNLTVTATGTNGCLTQKTYVVANQSNPAGSLGTLGSTTGLCAPAIVPFTIGNWQLNSPGTQYILNYGDGNIETFNHPLASSTINHIYTTSSCPQLSFTATLTVVNACDSTPYTAGNIQVRIKPDVQFTGPASACQTQNVCFTNTTVPGSFGNCSTLVSYTWDFGDVGSGSSNIVTSNSATPPNGCHTFSGPGVYTVTLSATNPCGTNTYTKTICIESPPTAAFTVNSNAGCAPFAVQATNSSTVTSSCTPTYEWIVVYSSANCGTNPGSSYNYFTNGTTSASANPSFNFPNSGTYTITLKVVSPCNNASATTIKTITVKKPPVVDIGSIPAAGLCVGQTFTPTANVTTCGTQNATYLWTFDGGTPATASIANPGPVSFATSGSHNITLAVITECGTETKVRPITINATPTLNAIANQEKCKGELSNAIVFSGTGTGVTYSWTNNNTSIGLAASASNATSISPFTLLNTTNTVQEATITVTPKIGTCTGVAQTFTIKVNPQATVNNINNLALCHNATQAAITPVSNVGAATFTWTNSHPSIGLAASGNGNIPSFTATNSGTAPIVATITVTPEINGCTGMSRTFTITVNPTPAPLTLPNKDLCHNMPSDTISFGSTTGTTYTWTNSDPSIGLAASGTSSSISFTANNTTTSPKVATITVTPTANGCIGAPQTFTITVNPSAAVTFSQPAQTICSGGSTTAVNLTSTTAGAVFAWTAVVPTGVTGATASGTDTIPVQTLLNSTNAPLTVSYKATAAINGGVTCAGAEYDTL